MKIYFGNGIPYTGLMQQVGVTQRYESHSA
jgi:hypothetical protein